METILFLCPHNAAKGILAEAYFNHRAKQIGLPFQADSAGTDPSEQIWSTVVDLLGREEIPLTSPIPRKVTRDDILNAFQVVSLGCAIEEVEGLPQRFTVWEDVPLASRDLWGSWRAIRSHVEQLLSELAHEKHKGSPETVLEPETKKREQ